MGRAQGQGAVTAGATRRGTAPARPTEDWEKRCYASSSVDVAGIPGEFTLGGEEWVVRPEFHVSWFAGARHVDAVMARHGLSEAAAREFVEAALARVTAARGLPQVTAVGDELRRCEKDDRRSLIAMCNTAGLEEFAVTLGGELGIEVPVPPAHVTIAAGPGMYGIGITSNDELSALSAPVAQEAPSGLAPKLAASWSLPVSEDTLLAARDSVSPANVYESYCFDASEKLQRTLAEAGVEAHLCEAGVVRDESHVYLVLDDGTIVDPTLDQFYRGGRGNVTGDWQAQVWEQRDLQQHGEKLPNENQWMGRLAVIPADHPFAAHYHSHHADFRSDEWEEGYWVKGSEPAWWRRLHRGV